MEHNKAGTTSPGTLKDRLVFCFTIVALSGLFIGSMFIVVVVYEETESIIGSGDLEWWKRSLIYHVYIPSFYDTNNDGFGDLRGVKEKLSYIQSLGVDGIWLSPFYTYGGADIGNDVINHMTVDPMFGTEQDLQELFDDIAKRGMHVILDFIPNHTSEKSAWFNSSVYDKDGPYGDFYIWADPLNDDSGKMMPPNEWIAATGESAWDYNDIRKQYYFHNFLPQMPDLNLSNPNVVEEIKTIMDFWLNKKPVMGFHIGDFNILFEDWSKDTITTDIEASKEFINMMHNHSAVLTDNDKLDRLFLLEMFSGEYINSNEFYLEYVFRKQVKNAEVPFCFGDIPWRLENNSFTGFSMEETISFFLKEDDENKDIAWPFWELNDHEEISGQGEFDHGRIPKDFSDITLITAMMLPGTVIIYYGDEIGMANSTNISFDETQDPYALPPYANETNYRRKSRDPFRTPMQWDESLNAGFTGNETEPWLPIANDSQIINVATENITEGSQLKLFQKLGSFRHHKALHGGKVFFPFSDEHIFSFIRKDDYDGTAFLVVTHLGREEQVQKTIDFTSILPQVPAKGHIIATGIQHLHSTLTLGPVSMSNITIYPMEVVVILIDYD